MLYLFYEVTKSNNESHGEVAGLWWESS